MERKPVNRRDFVKSATMLSGAMMLGACKTYSGSGSSGELNADSASGERVRYSVYSPEGTRLLDVYDQIVGYLKNTKHGETSYWQALAQVHQDHCPHSNWFFLPWHRAYLYYFEELCRDVAKNKIDRKSGIDRKNYENWTLPYWNWNSRSTIHAAFFEKNNLKEPRAVGPNDHPPKEIFGDAAQKKLTANPDFYLFCSGPANEQRGPGASGTLEASPHNTIHVWIGGKDKVMASFMSPLDPIFWTHHCNIDRLWLEWTRKCMDAGMKFAETLPAKKDGEELDVDFWCAHDLTEFWLKNPGEKIKVKVSDTLDCKGGPLKFTYDTLRGKEPAPTKGPGGSFHLAGSSGKFGGEVPVMSTAKITNIKEGFVINEAKGTLTMKFKMEAAAMSAADKKLVADVVSGLMKGEVMTSSAALIFRGIQVADDGAARQMLLKFEGSYDADTKRFDLGTTGFFVHNHSGHGPTVVDLQIDLTSLLASFSSAADFENKVITVTASAVQVMDPMKPVKMDKKMFTGTQSTKVEASLELRKFRRV